MNLLKSIFKPIYNSFGRTIGRILAYILFGLLLLFIYSLRVDAKEFVGQNVSLNQNMFDLFSGYVDNISYKDNYVAFSYSCGSSSYNNSCYALAYGKNLVFNEGIFTGVDVNLVQYDYINNQKQLIVSNDANCSFSGDIYYSNLGFSSKLDGGVSDYEKTIILTICLFLSFYLVYIIFWY